MLVGSCGKVCSLFGETDGTWIDVGWEVRDCIAAGNEGAWLGTRPGVLFPHPKSEGAQDGLKLGAALCQSGGPNTLDSVVPTSTVADKAPALLATATVTATIITFVIVKAPTAAPAAMPTATPCPTAPAAAALEATAIDCKVAACLMVPRYQVW